MKSWKKSPLIIVALVLLVAVGLLSLKMGVAAQVTNTDSGITGLQGPPFTLGLMLAATTGNNPDAAASGVKVFNDAPYALSGYVLDKFNGSVHVSISQQCSQVVLDLGFKPGDVVTIFCSESQVTDINTGDFVEFYGFTVRGYLVYSDHVVLPAPFSY